MRNKTIKRFLFLFFISFFCILYNPHISLNVVALATESTDFNDGTLGNQNYTTSWLQTGRKNYSFEIANYLDDRCIKLGVLASGWFNYTYSTSHYITEWEAVLGPEHSAGIHNGGGLKFYNSDDELIIWITYTPNQGFFSNIDNTGTPDSLGVINDWDAFKIEIKENDSLEFFVNDISVCNSSQRYIRDGLDARVDYVFINAPNKIFAIDNHSITVTEYFPEEYGNFTINVFNESDVESAIVNYDVHILNKIGGLIYSATNQTNPTVINNVNFGSGYRFFLIEHDDYSSRMFGAVFDARNDYSLNVLLAPVNDSLLYYVKVIDQLETPIYNASVEIVKTVNGTVYNIAGLLTDTFGYAGIYLLGDETYWVNVSKEGYNSINGARWDTDPDNYGIDNPKIFQLSISTVDDVVYYDFYTHIGYTGVMQNNNSILITYKDRLELTDNTQIKTFETYNGTDTLVNITNTTDNNNFNFYIEGINATRIHYADLYFNHSYNFTVNQPVRIFIYPVNYTGIPHTNATNLEDAITAVFGVNPLGWGNCIAVAIALMLLVSFGPYNAPVGVISCGLGLAIPKLAFAINNPLLFALIPVIVIIGIIYVIVKNPEVNI